ncbi:hypothetical protein O2N63_00010 [Aliiroseovarius sp. KMU-50]|uniref:XRE family transcriptional regulator n=1 Tax=Aliiroseovarius salicola TaxID=3009082 RepID=A0ABT4VW38_9RHOB|nr:hypothetical protein [Aliiroseovarius sp. KMU-50]MDA5092472.1 hypothetical protein [Aliiroseovarius sp. KMU-50]
MTKRPYPAWQHRHEAVLLWMLQNPAGKRYECARATGYSRWQISRIVNSPEFKRRYQEVLDWRLEQVALRMFDGRGSDRSGEQK